MGMQNRKQFAKWKPGDKVKPRTVTGPGLTKQEFAKECDINVIMERYRATGQLPANLQEHQAVFADVSGFGDFGDVLRRTELAKESFLALPAKIRSRFENDPVLLIEFLQDESNRDEAVSLGLMEAPAKPASSEPAKPAQPPEAQPKA